MTNVNASMTPQPAVNLAMLQQQAGPSSPLASAEAACGASHSGEPISMNLNDANLKDFFRLIADISGLNANVRATIKSAVAGVSLSLMYPLPSAVTTGDGFTVAMGCDHTRGTCQNRFANLANFRGFPFVPPPQTAF